MSKDNYLQFDKQLVEIDVYRLRQGLGGLSKEDKLPVIEPLHAE